MKKVLLTGLVTVFLVSTLIVNNISNGQTPIKSDNRKDAVTAFANLVVKSQKTTPSIKKHDGKQGGGRSAMVGIGNLNLDSSSQGHHMGNVSQNDPFENYQSGAMMWCELANGRFIDPAKHKWQRKERFRIWFVSAVPVFVGIYQNYEHDAMKSKQVFPCDPMPDTFLAVPAGVSYPLPTWFEMDNDLEDEYISFTLTRVDDNQLIKQNDILYDQSAAGNNVVNIDNSTNININQYVVDINAVQNNTTNNFIKVPSDPRNRERGPAAGYGDNGGRLKGAPHVFDAMKTVSASTQPRTGGGGRSSMVATGNGGGNINGGTASYEVNCIDPPQIESANPNDVATIYLGSGKTTQFQIKFHKD